MSRFRFQALEPKTVCVGLNADGTKRMETFTREFCFKQADDANAMIAAGINIPACLSHLDSARPVKMSLDEFKIKKNQGTIGWVEGYEKDPTGKVFANVEVPDESDAKHVKKIRFCSPKIDQFTDGNGKDWGMVMHHLAVVPRPRQHPQPAAVQLAIELAIDPESGEDVPDEKPPKKDEGDEGKPPEEEKKPEEKPAGDVKKALAVLAGLTPPIQLPEDTTAENFMDRLITAGMAIAAAKEPESPNDQNGNIQESEERPIVMALENEKKQLATFAKMSLKNRAKTLFDQGQINRPIMLSLEEDVEKAVIEIDDKGAPKSIPLMAKLEAYEALPKNSAWAARATGENPGNIIELDLPEELTGKKPSDKDILAKWDATGNAKA